MALKEETMIVETSLLCHAAMMICNNWIVKSQKVQVHGKISVNASSFSEILRGKSLVGNYLVHLTLFHLAIHNYPLAMMNLSIVSVVERATRLLDKLRKRRMDLNWTMAANQSIIVFHFVCRMKIPSSCLFYFLIIFIFNSLFVKDYTQRFGRHVAGKLVGWWRFRIPRQWNGNEWWFSNDEKRCQIWVR